MFIFRDFAMNMFDLLFSSTHMLNEQIAQELFDIMPEQGVVAAITDDLGNWWPSNEDKFRQILSDRGTLEHMCSRVDDGEELVVGQIADFGVVVSQLSTESLDCGYLVIALEKHTHQATVAQMDMVELIINQTNLIARLIEQNNQTYHDELKKLNLELSDVSEFV